jgi:hypothetical protein
LPNGKQVYPTTTFESVIDTDFSDQFSPDIGIRARKTPGKNIITIKDLIPSIGNVEKQEKTSLFNQMQVVVFLHRIGKNGNELDFPEMFPVEEITISDSRMVLQCNDFACNTNNESGKKDTWQNENLELIDEFSPPF